MLGLCYSDKFVTLEVILYFKDHRDRTAIRRCGVTRTSIRKKVHGSLGDESWSMLLVLRVFMEKNDINNDEAIRLAGSLGSVNMAR